MDGWSVGWSVIGPSRLAHVPAKACTGLDPGWTPVRRQEHAPKKQTRGFYWADVGQTQPGACATASPTPILAARIPAHGAPHADQAICCHPHGCGMAQAAHPRAI